MRLAVAVTAVLILCGTAAQGQDHPPARPASLPAPARTAPGVEVELAGGDLRLMNLFRVQGEILGAGASGAPPEVVVERLVGEVYAPYAAFWAGYLGDEAAFRRWVPALLGAGHPIHSRLDAVLGLDLDGLYLEAVAWLERTTGRRPQGRWYLLFGPGWTNMGGLGDGRMLVDFTQMPADPEQIAGILPHELTHQVHKVSAAADPDRETVLGRIVSEGLACYAAWLHGAGARSRAWAVSFQEHEWSWAVEHEDALWEAARVILASGDRADTDRVTHRGRQLIPGSPGAAGYFLGFRMVEAYVAQRGPDSWQEIFDLPVAEVLSRSGYMRR
jgi:hypothetical protein